MNKTTECDVIYTPVYRGDRYLYHECSECKYQVQIQQSVLTPLYFGESFKYCPNCGSVIVRFANLPKFVEDFNYAVFEKLDDFSKEFKDKVDYYCRVTLTKDEFEEMKSKCKFAVELNKDGGRSVSVAVRMVAETNSRKWSHWDIKKLRERIEGADLCRT